MDAGGGELDDVRDAGGDLEHSLFLRERVRAVAGGQDEHALDAVEQRGVEGVEIAGGGLGTRIDPGAGGIARQGADSSAPVQQCGNEFTADFAGGTENEDHRKTP
ncbi:hypothetical protein AORI_0971 [Amycolatopsis keratiniphila]|uniref:Uncharacterized protein n=1 Tax=Amycolatopsis keratiniphila TaxID=129921 RepID=R4SLD2_9PSEU|nr:hypothetical protein AORI_0971 [Amycolatopsis keratiniphila]